MRATLELTGGDFTHILSDEFLDGVIQDFTKNFMLNAAVPGSLASQYYLRANNADGYALRPLQLPEVAMGQQRVNNRTPSKDLEKQVRQNSWLKYQMAFETALPTLWNEIRRIEVVRGQASIGTRLGDMSRLMNIPIGISMPGGRRSKSPYNSFFMATEFGTGVYANRKYRRTVGSSKVGNKGVWAYDSGHGNSPLFLGQKPFNLFFNKSGEQRNAYLKFAARRLPILLKKALKAARQRNK